MSSLPIKRQKLTQSIRKKQIESLKRYVRLSFMNQSQPFDEHKFYQLYLKCKSTQFNKNSCEILIDYLYFTKIYQFQLQKVLNVIQRYLKQFGTTNKQSQKKISQILSKIISLILIQQQNQKKGLKYKSKNQYTIIQYLFQELIDCMNVGYYSVQIFAVWQQLFLISHKDISLRFFSSFIEIIKSQQFNTEIICQQINIIIKSFVNFSSHQFYQTFNIQIVETSLQILQIIYQTYTLGLEETLLVLQFIKQLINSKQQSVSIIRIKKIANTKICSQIISNISDQNLNIVENALQVLIKIFSFNDFQNILNKILIQNNSIMYRLKNLLPIQIKLLKKKISFSQTQMIPQNQIITELNKKVVNQAIILISNIVATNKKFVEICLQDGIFEVLVIMFVNCHTDIKQNISFVFLNMCLLANYQQIQLMVQLNLLQIIIDLLNLKELSDSFYNGLVILKQVLLVQNSNNNSKGKTRQFFSIRSQINKMKLQYQNSLNSILFSDNKCSKHAQQCLQLLDLIESETQRND